jgi:cytochrome c biogenesis protein ResB
LRFEPVSGGEAHEATIPRNGSADVPGIGIVDYVGFFADFDMTNEGPVNASLDYHNPVAQLKVLSPDGKSRAAFALNAQLAGQYLDKATEQARGGEESPLLVNGYKVLLKDFEKVALAHTLAVQYDPGRIPFYFGSMLLVLSLCGVFFFSHQRAWAVIERDGDGSRVHFGGNTNRNRPAFEGRFNSLVQSVIGVRSQR